jgi:FlaG/FlaF family flagellin (archaellin)
MSRFDNELTKTAENAYQQTVGEGKVTTPRQAPYDQTTTINLDGPFGLSSQAPKPAEEAADWIANQPAVRLLEVRDLDAADEGEIVGGPGSSAVYAEGGPMYASLDDSLYEVYKESRKVRDAIDARTDFDFSGLVTAANKASSFIREASTDQEIVYTIGSVAGIINDIENDLVVTANYKQAYTDLKSLEDLLETVNKVASSEDDGDDDSDDDNNTVESSKASEIQNRIQARKNRLASIEGCTCDGEGSCDACKKSKKEAKKAKKAEKKSKKKASNGNQETLQITDVRDLDDSGSNFTFEKAISPDHTTNVLVPEEVNGEDAGYVPFYNDGAESGVTPQVDEDRNPFPFDGSNPALVPYQQVQASREKVLGAIQVVEKLEKLGMVNTEDRFKHIASFEQMSDDKLEGIKASIDMFEKSGARQSRSQKVASGNNRLPEMGRLTTATSTSRQDIQSDDWLMTL